MRNLTKIDLLKVISDALISASEQYLPKEKQIPNKITLNYEITNDLMCEHAFLVDFLSTIEELIGLGRVDLSPIYYRKKFTLQELLAEIVQQIAKPSSQLVESFSYSRNKIP